MNHPASTCSSSIGGLILLGCLAAVVGCTSVETTKSSPLSTAPTSTAKPADVTTQREQRTKAVASEFDEQRDRAQYQAALSRWRQGDESGPRETLAPVLARCPDHREAQLLAAQLDLSDDKPKIALEHARRVLANHPDDPQAHYLAALALDALGAASDALPHYEKAAQLAPKEEIYQVSYQAALGGTIAPAGGSDQAALSAGAAEAAHAENPVSLPAGPRTANADLAVEQRLAVLRAAAEAHPDDQQIPLDAAVYALRQKRPEMAVTIVSAALQHLPDSAPLHRLLGMAYLQQGDFNAAQLSLGRAISLDKSNALAYFLMGTTLTQLGDAEAARKQFDEAARLDPRYGQRPN